MKRKEENNMDEKELRNNISLSKANDKLLESLEWHLRDLEEGENPQAVIDGLCGILEMYEGFWTVCSYFCDVESFGIESLLFVLRKFLTKLNDQIEKEGNENA